MDNNNNRKKLWQKKDINYNRIIYEYIFIFYLLKTVKSGIFINFISIKTVPNQIKLTKELKIIDTWNLQCILPLFKEYIYIYLFNKTVR